MAQLCHIFAPEHSVVNRELYGYRVGLCRKQISGPVNGSFFDAEPHYPWRTLIPIDAYPKLPSRKTTCWKATGTEVFAIEGLDAKWQNSNRDRQLLPTMPELPTQ